MKAVAFVPSGNSTVHRRTKGTRKAPPVRRFSSWPDMVGDSTLFSAEHRAVRPGPAGDPPPGKGLEQPGHEIPRQARHVLDGRHVQPRSRGKALANAGLEALQVLPQDERLGPHALENAVRDEHARDALEERAGSGAAGRDLRDLDARK